MERQSSSASASLPLWREYDTNPTVSNFEARSELLAQNEAKKLTFKIDDYFTETITETPPSQDKPKLVINRVYSVPEEGLVQLKAINGDWCSVSKNGRILRVKTADLSNTMAAMIVT